MSVVALQPSRFVEGLSIGALIKDDLFNKLVAATEQDNGPDCYWDGDLEWHRCEELKRIRRRLEDRLRKDKFALERAYRAVFLGAGYFTENLRPHCRGCGDRFFAAVEGQIYCRDCLDQ